MSSHCKRNRSHLTGMNQGDKTDENGLDKISLQTEGSEERQRQRHPETRTTVR